MTGYIYNKVFGVLAAGITAVLVLSSCTVNNEHEYYSDMETGMWSSGEQIGRYAGFWTIGRRNVSETEMTAADMSLTFSSFPCGDILKTALGCVAEVSVQECGAYTVEYVQNGFSSSTCYYVVNTDTYNCRAVIDGRVSNVSILMENTATSNSQALYSRDVFTVMLRVTEVRVDYETVAVFTPSLTLMFNTTNRIR